MRPWDRARWRIQGKWTHDLPKGWKVMPSVETFLGTRWVSSEAGNRSEPMPCAAVDGGQEMDQAAARGIWLSVAIDPEFLPVGTSTPFWSSMDLDPKRPSWARRGGASE